MRATRLCPLTALAHLLELMAITPPLHAACARLLNRSLTRSLARLIAGFRLLVSIARWHCSLERFPWLICSFDYLGCRNVWEGRQPHACAASRLPRLLPPPCTSRVPCPVGDTGTIPYCIRQHAGDLSALHSIQEREQVTGAGGGISTAGP